MIGVHMEHAYTLVIRDAHASLYDSSGASVMLIDTHVAIHVERGYTVGPDKAPRLIPALDVPPRSSQAHGGLWAGLDGLMQVQGYGVALIPTGRDAYAEALTYAQAHGGTLTVRDVREATDTVSPEEPEPEDTDVLTARKALKDARTALRIARCRKASRKAMRRAQAIVVECERAYSDAKTLSDHAARLSVENQVQNVTLDRAPVIVGPKGLPARLSDMPKAYEVWEHRSMWHVLLGNGLSVHRPA